MVLMLFKESTDLSHYCIIHYCVELYPIKRKEEEKESFFLYATHSFLLSSSRGRKVLHSSSRLSLFLGEIVALGFSVFICKTYLCKAKVRSIGLFKFEVDSSYKSCDSWVSNSCILRSGLKVYNVRYPCAINSYDSFRLLPSLIAGTTQNSFVDSLTISTVMGSADYI